MPYSHLPGILSCPYRFGRRWLKIRFYLLWCPSNAVWQFPRWRQWVEIKSQPCRDLWNLLNCSWCRRQRTHRAVERQNERNSGRIGKYWCNNNRNWWLISAALYHKNYQLFYFGFYTENRGVVYLHLLAMNKVKERPQCAICWPSKWNRTHSLVRSVNGFCEID